ncbi:MAG: hypothetical protein LBG51_02730 [Bacteroidales bacterium OttesenSCG-928-I14]|nr:hypothetical protein [Bacteroidales bacterium OttesenSCG-928-I14]
MLGTQGPVKAVHFNELEKDTHTKIILCNTYHLYLRPGKVLKYWKRQEDHINLIDGNIRY